MERREIMSLLSIILVAILFSLSMFAATATSTGASAYVTSAEPDDLLARARINSSLYWANQTDEGWQTVASASVSASDLPRVDIYPPVASYATEWIGVKEIDTVYWP